jgi:hypothetical protein
LRTEPISANLRRNDTGINSSSLCLKGRYRVKFFFPDAQDYVDPNFDFTSESHARGRMRLRDDRYAHEVFSTPPFDGILISKAIVEGAPGAPGKYSLAQRHRLLRSGAREFLRFGDRASTARLKTIGDCGAFSYVREHRPPFSVASVVDFYANCDFDYGISVDHVILDYDREFDSRKHDAPQVPESLKERQEITLSLAKEFLKERASLDARFEPVGVAQGWSPRSYAKSVSALQRMGYRYIALGGMVPMKTSDIHEVLEQVATVRETGTKLHLLGVTRVESMKKFASFGVASFDTTSPFRRAFKDATENYFTPARNYTALRIPQVEGNRRLHILVQAGKVNQTRARKLERDCLSVVRAFASGNAEKEEVLELLTAYHTLCGDLDTDRVSRYAETLDARPWDSCSCDVCKVVGVEVIIFRGSERNKRRGFHNIWVSHAMVTSRLSKATAATGEKRR